MKCAIFNFCIHLAFVVIMAAVLHLCKKQKVFLKLLLTDLLFKLPYLKDSRFHLLNWSVVKYIIFEAFLVQSHSDIGI